MSRRIVVGLDGSPYSASALDLALRRAQFYRATVIGVAVIDQPAIEHLAIGAPPGVLQLSHESLSVVFVNAKKRAETLIAAFRALCTKAGVEHEDIIHSGPPSEGLLDEGRTADLIITGLRTYFHYPGEDDSSETLSALLRHPVCPVLAVPETPQLPQNVILAYDGSVGAVRAMHAYVHVTPTLPKDITVTLFCVAKEYEKHKFHLEKAAVFLRAHGLQPQIVIRSGQPAAAIREIAHELQPSLVILGAPVYRGLGERLFGSVTRAIIDDGAIPIFVFH
jgi:nucleotide-binding universal stress UspA family protein